MRYAELYRILRENGCYATNGKKHDKWYSPITGKKISRASSSIPRSSGRDAEENNERSRYQDMKAVYPCIIRWNNADEVYDVRFPDIENCYTDGADMYEAVDNAEDVLNLMLSDYEADTGKKPPIPTDIKTLKVNSIEIATLIRADTEEYSEKLKRQKEEELYRDIKSLKANVS